MSLCRYLVKCMFVCVCVKGMLVLMHGGYKSLACPQLCPINSVCHFYFPSNNRLQRLCMCVMECPWRDAVSLGLSFTPSEAFSGFCFIPTNTHTHTFKLRHTVKAALWFSLWILLYRSGIFWTSSLCDSGVKLKAPFSEKMAGSHQIAPPPTHFLSFAIVWGEREWERCHRPSPEAISTEGLGSSPARLQTIRTSRQELRTHKHTPFHRNTAGARPGELRTTLTSSLSVQWRPWVCYSTAIFFNRLQI